MPSTMATSEGTIRRNVLNVSWSERKGLVETGEIWRGGGRQGEVGEEERMEVVDKWDGLER